MLYAKSSKKEPLARRNSLNSMQTAQAEGSAPKEAPAAPAPGPNIHWVGQPMYIHNDLAHYKATNVAGQQISLG